MHSGLELRDIRGSGWRTRARRDDEGWRGVHRHGRLYQARPGDVGKATPALDPQIYGVFLTVPVSKESFRADALDSAKKAGMLSHG